MEEIREMDNLIERGDCSNLWHRVGSAGCPRAAAPFWSSVSAAARTSMCQRRQDVGPGEPHGGTEIASQLALNDHANELLTATPL